MSYSNKVPRKCYMSHSSYSDFIVVVIIIIRYYPNKSVSECAQSYVLFWKSNTM